jgi:integrase
MIGKPLTLAGARKLAAEVHLKRASGESVTTAKQGGDAFADAARAFITEHSKPKVRGWQEHARLLGLVPETLEEISRGLASRWRTKPVTDVTAADIFAVVDEAKRRGVPGLERRKKDGLSESRARAMLSCLSRMFRYLLEHQRVEANPCTSIIRPPPPRARSRTLTDDEIRAFWQACEMLNPPFGPVLRLCLLTAARLNEVAALRWDELVDGEIRLPGQRTKNHREHTIPLAPLAQQIIAGVQRFPNSELVFTTTGTTPVSGWSKVKNRIDALMGPIPEWRFHDLRRSAATGMGRCGADPHVVERALNHVSGSFGGVAGVYQQHRYRDEVRAALEAWGALVAKIVGAQDRPQRPQR